MNRRLVSVLCMVAVVALAMGCGKRTVDGPKPDNIRPVIEITLGAVNSNHDRPLLLPYSAHFGWLSSDPDGFVDHYVYTTSDSAGNADTTDADSSTWRSTKLHEV